MHAVGVGSSPKQRDLNMTPSSVGTDSNNAPREVQCDFVPEMASKVVCAHIFRLLCTAVV